MAPNVTTFHDCSMNDIKAMELMKHGYGKHLLMWTKYNQSVPREEHLPFTICSGTIQLVVNGISMNVLTLHRGTIGNSRG